MASSMVAVTTDGTLFSCASISLTESGVAVLDGSGSRLGFVPYSSLQYVTPCVDEQGDADGTGLSGDLQVVAADGSEFACAAISQTTAGIATLAPSGERTGFVPYDTLEYILPEQLDSELPEGCSLPPGIAHGAAADEPEEDVTEEFGGDDSDAETGADEADAEEEETDEGETEESTSDEQEGVWEDAQEEAENDGAADSTGTESDSASGSESESEEDDEDSLWEAAEESTEPVDPEAPVVEGEGNADAEAEAGAEQGDTEAEAEAEADADAEAAGDSQQAEREEAGESEMQVEWSFGEYEE